MKLNPRPGNGLTGIRLIISRYPFGSIQCINAKYEIRIFLVWRISIESENLNAHCGRWPQFIDRARTSRAPPTIT